ncbi:carboxypeptidase regulatory-like domain-containing protein [bacterium]|nr:carboxypeptidase regulatory-like domain-containing protein [bacterium]
MRRAGLTLAVLLILTSVIFAQDWTYPISVYSGDRSNMSTIYFGVDYRASDCFDTLGLDVPFIPPPWGFGAYFVPPCTDGLPPGVSYLTTDLRKSEAYVVKEWIVQVTGDYSSFARLITWDPSMLPLEPDTGDTSGGGLFRTTALAESMWIGERAMGVPGEPAAWVNMESVDSFLLGPGNEAVIRVAMVGAVDHDPPVVSAAYPDSAHAEGTQRTDSIHFNITDDVAGVDLTSLSVWLSIGIDSLIDITSYLSISSIPSGYHCRFEHLSVPGDTMFPGDEDICVYVMAQDLASPPHVMDTVSWCFHTAAEPPGDCDAPTFEEWSIDDGDTLAGPTESIVFLVRDWGGIGVDVSSITVEVDGADWTGACFFERMGVSFDYRVTVPPRPLSGWGTGTSHTIVVNACDMATPPPCGPNCAAPETLTFYVGMDSLVEWNMSLDVNSDAGPTTHLYFGMDEEGSDGFDTGLDVPLILPPPGYYAYFELSDPTHPEYTMLTTDIRHLETGVQTWYIGFENASGACSVTWEPTSIPELVEPYILRLYVGHGPDEGSITWTDMRGSNTMSFNPTDVLMLKAEVYDTLHTTGVSPYITNLNPPAGASDVPLGSTIQFDIRDNIGVDPSSIVVRLNGFTQTYSLVDTFWNGYRVSFTPDLAPDMLYNVNVLATDIDAETHSLDTTYSFSTGSICGPLFNLHIGANDSAAGGGVNHFEVIIGVDTSATSGYDVGLDNIAPPPPGFYARINNPEDDSWDYFEDIRNNCPSSEWHIYLGNVTGDAQWLTWSSSLIPYDALWKLKIAVSSGPRPSDAEFIDMASISRIDFSSHTDTAFVVWKVWTAEDFYCISGIITDHITGDPIEGALVTIGGASDNSNDSGFYQLCNIPAGDYDLTVTMDGYYDTTISVSITDTMTLDIELTPYCYNVSGTTFVDGVPTAGVTYVIGPVEGVSGVGGVYSECLTPGEYEVVASYPTYPDFVDTITVVDTDIDYNIYIVRSDFNLTGTVTLLPDSDPGEGTEIYVDGVLATTAGSDGSYATTVSYGGHTIRAHLSGYVDGEVVLGLVDRDTVVDFALSPGPVQVCFNVTDGTSPIEGALVEMPPYTAITTNASGVACFDSVDWGDYDVTVSLAHYADAETSITVNADMDVDIVLNECCAITDLAVDFAPDSRPLTDSLHATLTWTEPACALTPVTYHIYRDDVEIGTSDTPGYDDYTIVDGESYDYYVVVEYEECESENSNVATLDVEVSPDDADILVIDFDNGAGYTEDLTDVLDAILVSTDYTVTLQDEDITIGGKYDLDDYTQVIVVLGIRGDASDEVMPAAMTDALAGYGGCIYVEGPDFGHDYGTTDFFDNFHVSATEGNPSSVGNVDSVRFSDEYFGEAWYVNYPFGTDADNYVASLSPLSGASPVFYADSDSTVVGVAYGNRVYTSIFITELSSDLPGQGDVPGRVLGQILENCGFTTTDIEVHSNVKPAALSIVAAPNPFNASCDITFDLPKFAVADVSVFDVNGNRVVTLYHGALDGGRYTIRWDAQDVPSGNYIVKLNAEGFSSSTRVTLVK